MLRHTQNAHPRSRERGGTDGFLTCPPHASVGIDIRTFLYNGPVAAPAPVLTPQQTAAIARALAEPRRFSIFEQIAHSETISCSDLAVHGSITAATISHHLKDLADAGLIEIVREGRTMRLSLNRAVWNAYLDRLRAL